MEIRVIDFEVITKNYQNYQDGIKKIDDERKRTISKLDPLKSEMESIVKLSSGALIVDQSLQRSRSERFQQLQEEAMIIDSEFKALMKDMRGDLNLTVYEELSVIISEWSEKNSIDLVTGKMEVVYSNKKYDATNDILDVLKEKGLFVTEMEKESI